MGTSPHALIDAFGQRTLRALGQHFLTDVYAVGAVVRHSGAAPGRAVVEVGPGPGVLTIGLLEAGAHVVAIEKDRRAVEFLNGPFREFLSEESASRLTIVEGDAMREDPRALLEANGLGQPWFAAGNLPYNVGTGILNRYLSLSCFQKMAFMFQKEVAERLVSPPGSKAYGSLSLAVQARAEASIVYTLGPEAFTPPPKVSSAIVAFDLEGPPRVDAATLKDFERVVRAAFSKRRKTIRNALKAGLGGVGKEEIAAILERAGIDGGDRAERVELERFLRLAVAWRDVSAGR